MRDHLGLLFRCGELIIMSLRAWGLENANQVGIERAWFGLVWLCIRLCIEVCLLKSTGAVCCHKWTMWCTSTGARPLASVPAHQLAFCWLKITYVFLNDSSTSHWFCIVFTDHTEYRILYCHFDHTCHASKGTTGNKVHNYIQHLRRLKTSCTCIYPDHMILNKMSNMIQ